MWEACVEPATSRFNVLRNDARRFRVKSGLLRPQAFAPLIKDIATGHTLARNQHGHSRGTTSRTLISERLGKLGVRGKSN